MEYTNRFVEASKDLLEEEQGKTGSLDKIMSRIRKGEVIPVISSSFRIEQIFNSATGAPASEGEGTHEQLVAAWAQVEKYPMLDQENLARVYQYVLVEKNKDDDPLLARAKYFNFLKRMLIRFGSKDLGSDEERNRLKEQADDIRFSEIATTLDYPRYVDASDDPLRLLARFPLKYYITTSQSDFLERALELEGKSPVTQICFWSGALDNVLTAHQTDPEFRPTDTKPLVYHLFGLENYPQTLVLSEDDYINFLIAIMGDNDAANPKVPLSLRNAIRSSQLILLGYKLTDWDFRVLFRILLKYRTDELVPRGMLIQIEKNEKGIDDLKNYLNKYFDKNKFSIEWNSAEAFVRKLWTEWNNYRKS